MARANWTYIKVDDLLPESRKLDHLSTQGRMNILGTLIEVWTYCDRNLTDGFVSTSRWISLGSSQGRRLMLSQGFAERADDGRDGYQCHDYLGHQRSRAEVEQQVENARKAARKRWDGDAPRNAPRNAPGIAPRNAPGTADRTADRNADGNAEHRRAEHKDPSVPADDLQVEARTSPPAGSDDDDSIGSEIEANPLDHELALAVQREVRLRTGGGQISEADALALAERLLGGRVVHDRIAYLRRVIQDEPRPRERFLIRAAAAAQQPPPLPPPRYQPADVAGRGAALARELLKTAGEPADELPF